MAVQPIPVVTVQRLWSGDGTASLVPPPGVVVYENTVESNASYFTPGANRRMADDLVLATGACNAVYYSIVVFSPDATDAFDVTMELWDDDPCEPVAAPIPGTRQVSSAIQPGAWLLEYDFSYAPAAIPDTVWLAATFSTDTAGWIVAGEAETGSTANLWSWDSAYAGCGLFQFTPPKGPHGGFYASVNCAIAQSPVGACCEGTSCTEKTQAECLGVFRGDGTQCLSWTCDQTIPATSQWGLVLVTLLGLIVGTIVFRRRLIDPLQLAANL